MTITIITAAVPPVPSLTKCYLVWVLAILENLVCCAHHRAGVSSDLHGHTHSHSHTHSQGHSHGRMASCSNLTDGCGTREVTGELSTLHYLSCAGVQNTGREHCRKQRHYNGAVTVTADGEWQDGWRIWSCPIWASAASQEHFMKCAHKAGCSFTLHAVLQASTPGVAFWHIAQMRSHLEEAAARGVWSHHLRLCQEGPDGLEGGVKRGQQHVRRRCVAVRERGHEGSDQEAPWRAPGVGDMGTCHCSCSGRHRPRAPALDLPAQLAEIARITFGHIAASP
jgi:hypothetical protein